MRLNKLIGDTLTDIIDEKNLKLVELSNLTGYTQGYLSKVVNGQLPKLPIETLERIISPLGFSLSEFLEEVEKKRHLQLQP